MVERGTETAGETEAAGEDAASGGCSRHNWRGIYVYARVAVGDGSELGRGGGSCRRRWGSAKKSGAISAGGGESRAAARYSGEPGADDVDPELREYLREWRRVTSKEMKTAAFIVMHDSSLNELCRVRPKSLEELRRVSGFGGRKTELYGPQILEALERFRNGARARVEE